MAASSAAPALDQYSKGVRAWFPDKDEAWIGAELVDKEISETDVKLVFQDAQGKTHTYESKLAEVRESPGLDRYTLPPLRNPPLLEQTEDLTNLSYLNEPSVLHSIRTRYQFQQIYTYSGIVLVAVNPFSAVPLYSNDYVQMYAGRRKGELDPHLFAIAEDAYRCMIREGKNQTVIVSGESGAGKTVSAKYIMRYFATVDDPDKPGERRKAAKDDSGMSKVEQQILATNPIMEAFGNAKTTRNDNSSRFGKYIEILFDDTATIVGARIRTYLLERSRLVYQAETERNYHIFYQLLAGAPPSDRGSLGLKDISDFNYLSQGGDSAYAINGVDDAEEFRVTQKALSTVGITSERQWQIFSVLAALLHLGNINITQARTDAYLEDDEPNLLLASKLLGIDAGEFKKWLIKKQIVTRSEKIVTSLNAAQATVVRDSVAKYIYSSLFDWLVNVINESLAPATVNEQVKTFIGVLDIYGFEHFKTNSFEQFCINYANEKLQQEFNAHVFKLEQEEYVSEKINWTFIDFSDNQPCIDLIEGKLGVLSLLDEESRLPAGSDASFVQKLYSQLAKPEHAKVFRKPRFGNTAFTINHYALDVTYETDGFLEKNRDTVPDEHLTLLANTENKFLKEVMDRSRAAATDSSGPTPTAPESAIVNKRASVIPAAVKKPGAGLSQRKPTLGSIFKSSLINLMDTIDSTNAHYIRCIKPNEAKAAWEFEPQMVLGQLRACGVLETIRISCAGYPSRWTFEEFAERYYMLTNSSTWGPEIEQLCTTILHNTIKDADKYQIGLTKLFFRAGMLAYLEKIRTDRLNYLVTLMQKNMLRVVQQKKYQAVRSTAIGLQSLWRRLLSMRHLELLRKEKLALATQQIIRRNLQRQRFLSVRQAVITIQSLTRGRQTRNRVAGDQRAAFIIRLQSLLRGRLLRQSCQTDRDRVVYLQACFRRKIARKELKNLKQEARSVTHFKEVSYKLENKVVELTQTLQKRTTENKGLQSKLSSLEDQLQSWMSKYDDAATKAKELKSKVDQPVVALPEFVALESQKQELDTKLADSLRKIEAQETQIHKLTEEFDRQAQEMEKRQKLINGASANGTEDSTTVAGLRQELNALREQLGKAIAVSNATPNIRSDPTFHMATGRTLENGGSVAHPASLAGPGTRRGRRGSASKVEGTEQHLAASDDDDLAGTYDPRTQLVSYPENGTAPFRASSSPAYIAELDDQEPAAAIMDLLENEEALDSDVLLGLIKHLKIPGPSLTNPPFAKEVLFPAHLISLVTNEMWKYGLMHESERFLANVMQTIQQHAMSFQSEEAIQPGIFWLSNVHEILSFVCIAENDILQGIGPGVDGSGREFDWDDYERLVGIVKHDLDSLEYNIYHTWIQETKKKLSKMIVPALIESQSLPGFVTNDGGGRLFNRLLQSNNTPTFTMDDLLNILNKVWKCLKSYYVEQSVIQQVTTELLKLIGVVSFNDLVMRRNFCSWKRAMQIQYNITRLEEWCKSHDMPEATLQLEHLMQATKLLQLKKATVQDIEIVQDVCWMLTPSQIHRLIANYYVADYESPIAPEILREVSSRVVPGDKTDHLLLPPDDVEGGPYETPLPRTIAGLETYIPAVLQLPTLKRLTQCVC